MQSIHKHKDRFYTKYSMSRRNQTLCLDEVLGLIDDDDDEPMMEGSKDEMDDLELDTDEMRVEADVESITKTITHSTVMSASTCDVHVQEGSSSSVAMQYHCINLHLSYIIDEMQIEYEEAPGPQSSCGVLHSTL